MTERKLIEALLKNEPYLGSAFRAFQGHPIRHAHMWGLVQRLAEENDGDPIEILEVGSWAGGSTMTWGLALAAARVRGRITCIDPWQPYFDTEIETGSIYHEMNEAAESDLIYRLFLHNIRAAGLADVVIPIRGRSANVLPTLPDAGFSIVFLDGSHQYEHVLGDIRSSIRLVRDGGILCGDDLEMTAAEVDHAEFARALDRGVDFICDPPTGRFYHPGVTKAVAEMLPIPSVSDGFWTLRKTTDGWVHMHLDRRNVVVPAHLQEAVAAQGKGTDVQLIESYNGFNLVHFDGRVVGIRQSLGEIPWQDGYGGLRAKFSHEQFISAATVDSVKRKIDGIPAKPQLIDSYGAFNLVRLGDRLIAVRQRLGEIRWSDSYESLHARYAANDFFSAGNIESLKQEIDRIS